MLADTLTRFDALKERPSLLSTGTDEHGLKIFQAAQAAQRSSLDFCDLNSSLFKDLFSKAHVKADFIRTTEKRHEKTVHHFWNVLNNKGYIYKGEHQGWYCISEETFVTENMVESRLGKMVLKENGKSVEWMSEPNYKFKLSAFRQPLLDWLHSNPQVIRPDHQYAAALKQLDRPLADLSISRLKTKVPWGISVPNDEEHVIYVWLDALVNYLTVSGYPENSSGPFFHVVGKDILKFHAVYWPAFLMAAGLEPPQQILSHGHWLVHHQKMSKSDGTGVCPLGLIEEFGIDAVRYFLIRDGWVHRDPEFSPDLIRKRLTHDLSNQLGNLLLRSTSKAMNKQGQFPRPGSLDEDWARLLEHTSRLPGYLD